MKAPLKITGLIDRANIKITDIGGNFSMKPPP
jgi:hypothetical protein